MNARIYAVLGPALATSSVEASLQAAATAAIAVNAAASLPILHVALAETPDGTAVRWHAPVIEPQYQAAAASAGPAPPSGDTAQHAGSAALTARQLSVP